MSFTENKNLMIFDNFVKEKENKVEENYQIIISDESLYLIKSSVNYGEYIKSIFSGAGDIIGLFGNTVGVLGGLASELTGHKFSQMLKEYSDKSSKKNTNKIIQNLSVKNLSVLWICFNCTQGFNLFYSHTS